MSKKRKIISSLLIVLGLLIAAYPIGNRLYVWYWQEKLNNAFDNDISLEIVANDTVESDFLSLQNIFVDESLQADVVESTTDVTPIDEPTSEELAAKSAEATTEAATTSTSTTTATNNGVIGRIVISKVDINMPILKGATEKNLNRGAAQISGTSDFGVIGNVGVAGHRGRSYGIYFNRLNEVAIGDNIEVVTKTKTYNYTVYKVSIVEPTDVSVLYRNDTDKILTLVTCDPVKNPTHRLIIHALQVP